MKKTLICSLAAICAVGATASLVAQGGAPSARTEFKTSDGKSIGTAQLQETPSGVLLKVELQGLTPGLHGFHIHRVGKCDPPSFKSAGEHFGPEGKPHGFKNPKGAHAGDLPNLRIPADGKTTFEVLVDQVTLKSGKMSLLDADGSALIIHAEADDYKAPAGESGRRIACAVITADK